MTVPKHGSVNLYVHGTEGSLGRTAQDVHLDSHTAPELYVFDFKKKGLCMRSVLINARRL